MEEKRLVVLVYLKVFVRRNVEYCVRVLCHGIAPLYHKQHWKIDPLYHSQPLFY